MLGYSTVRCTRSIYLITSLQPSDSGIYAVAGLHVDQIRRKIMKFYQIINGEKIEYSPKDPQCIVDDIPSVDFADRKYPLYRVIGEKVVKFNFHETYWIREVPHE